MNVVIAIAVTIAFLVTFAVFIAAVALAMITEQRKNRSAMKQLQRDFEQIVTRLGDEEEGWR